MVSLQTIRASNERVGKNLPPGLVAVFVGATNGVGETTVRQFAKYAPSPRVYIIGRSKEAGSRIVKECKALSPDGEFIFVSKDTSLMRNVDEICYDLKKKEESINLLFLTIGTLQMGKKTAEGLHYATALTVYARNRFISNLLPLINNATCLRRVVSTFVGGLEGDINMDDFQGWNIKLSQLMQHRGHAASITTLALEGHHQKYSRVSFIHNFPGVVKGGVARDAGWLFSTLSAVSKAFGRLLYMNTEEAGDRHLFLATRARYASGEGDDAAGVSQVESAHLARGIDGKAGSGVYSIDANGESADVEQVLAGLRKDGMVEKVMSRIDSDINDALSVESSS